MRRELHIVPATPAAKLVPSVMPRIPLDYTSKAERGVLISGQFRISIHHCPGSRPGEDTPASLESVEPTRELAVYGF